MEESKFEAKFSQNKILENLSKTNTYIAISIYILAATLAFYFGYKHLDIPLSTKFGLLFFGLFIFSLTEYLVHRYVYHFPKIGPFRNLAYDLHDFHHHHPKDKKRLAMPIPVAVVIAVVLAALFGLTMGIKGLLFFAGFMLGYAGYLLTHYLIHILGPVNPVMRYLWIHHSIHHFKDDTKAYGVSSPLWDWVFRSMPSKEQSRFMTARENKKAS
ncbi:sterol desaturase family protein [Mangrovibacterium lignilyticum]|uniref:sterol desaturase family protein n=1 Tax=Mangrovibacterium lignilyticum TaxID=2668052 RepID=UPI0013D6883A|nr:sterol desaturase family protein [Mangrovibacterium lignilyticum]